MQPAFHFPLAIFTKNRALAVAMLLVAALGGCRPPLPREVPKPRPFAGMTVRVACADPAYAVELARRGKVWGVRTGGTLTLETDWTKADAAILPPKRLGGLAAAGGLMTRPTVLSDRDNPLRWSEVLPAFQENLCNWGRRPVAVPVAGDGFVLVYRTDRFADPKAAAAHRARHQRELDPPRTWEDLRAVADTFFSLDGKPSLPPLPSDPAGAAVALNRVAACYDRSAGAGQLTKPEEQPPPTGSAFRFQVDADTAAPRLTAPSFVAAFGWFHDTAKFRPPAGDPRDALVNGSAVAAILSLQDVAKLPKGPGGLVDPRFAVAPIPGAAVWYGPDGKPNPAAGGRNYVPLLGAGGQLGVVFERTTVGEATWDFLTDWSGPDGADNTLGDLTLGAGPFRYSHLSMSEKAARWQRYGFDTQRTGQLARALAAFADPQVREPVCPIRTPDYAAREAILADAVRQAATGKLTGAQAAAEAQKAWLAQDAKTPQEELLKWNRHAVGLE